MSMSSDSDAVLVVGGDGFIGSRFINVLRHHRVNYVSATRTNSLLNPQSQAISSIEVSPPSTVFWLASSAIPMAVERNPTVIDQELSEFQSALTYLVQLRQDVCVVLLSSATVVYADESGTAAEKSAVKPFNRYGLLKLELENALVSSDATHVILRVTNAYGPGQRTGRSQGVIGEWLSAAFARRPLIVNGSLATRRDYIHIDDVTRAMFAVHKAAPVNETFNIGSGVSSSLEDVLNIVRDAAGYDLVLEHRDSRSFDRRSVDISVSKAESQLGWRSQIPLRQGILNWWDQLVRASSEGL